MTTATLERPAPAATAAEEFNPLQEGQRLMKAWYADLEQARARGQNVANVFVMGSAFFKSPDYKKFVDGIRGQLAKLG